MLDQHPAIREAVVTVREDNPGDKRLIGYIVSSQQLRPTSNELTNYLRDIVPEYMIPSAFVSLDCLPLTPNGKVDRRALPAPDTVQDSKVNICAPRTATEGVLSEIWGEILQVERVGIQENFFDLGGHSLLGSRLVEKVCQEFQIEFPLRWLFECPTVESMAVRVVKTRVDTSFDRREKSTWRYLFELKRGKNRQPVFFLPGGFGEDREFLVYARLVHYTGDDYGFYGLRAHSADGTEQAHTSVESMAADYLREMHVLQPDGPYFLIGNCIGGIVAYEIARQLEARGQEVALLVLMDTELPTLKGYLRYRGTRFKQRIRDFWRAGYLGLRDNYYIARTCHHFARMRESAWNEQVGYLISKTRVAIDESPNLLSSLVTNQFDAGSDHVREGYINTLRRYRPRPYQGCVVMLNNETAGRDDPTLGWKNFVRGGIDVHIIPGNHEAYIRQYVRIAGGKLRECLDDASSKNSSSRSPMGHKPDVEFEPKSVTRFDM
jgi:thioesterase domain-containing protein/acyl carrier protein